MEEKTQLQWLLAGIGVIVIALIYLWGIRSRLKEELRKRQRRSSASEPKLGETASDFSEADDEEVHEIGKLGRVTPEHPLADKILVDVEIRSLPRAEDAGGAPPKESPLLAKKAPPADAGNARATGGPVARPAPAPAEPAGSAPSDPPSSSRSKMTVALTILAPRHRMFKGSEIQAAAEEAGFLLSEAGLFERHPEAATSMHTPVFSLAHLRKPGSFQPENLADLITPGLLVFMTLPGPLEGVKALDLLVLSVDQVARKLNGVICDEHRRKLTNQALMSLRDRVARLEAPAH
ncbi:MAG: hypothetical protein JNM60_05525 [Candidatus Competibacteraceae bacterium]|nr:hypothetical protein [Candidatus Competibacteraceae bacterium]